MNPRIETAREKKLVGRRITMSLADNQTGKIWRNFVSRRGEIANTLTTELISMNVYEPTYFADFKPTNKFEKWATVEVKSFDDTPSDMETFTLKGGLYAVFDYQGSSQDDSIFQYIFGTWLPTSHYDLDDRPHFEVLGDRYRNNDPTSEEEIWIPIKQKNASH